MSHKEQKQQSLEYYYNHSEQCKARNREYKKRNWQKINLQNQEYKKKWLLTPSGKQFKINECIRRRHTKYGLTIQQLLQMETDQQGCCAICGKKFRDKKDIHIDHNHETSKVRQLLCCKCNCGLGYFGESINSLSNAIQYLTRWNVDGGY